jgi:hypothetical protein
MSRKNLAYRAISTMYKRFLAGSLRNRAKSARPPTTFGWLSATYSFDDDPHGLADPMLASINLASINLGEVLSSKRWQRGAGCWRGS